MESFLVLAQHVSDLTEPIIKSTTVVFRQPYVFLWKIGFFRISGIGCFVSLYVLRIPCVGVCLASCYVFLIDIYCVCYSCTYGLLCFIPCVLCWCFATSLFHGHC
jgi:hypothetical protein